MKKSIIKATAMAVLTAVVVTCFPIDSVKAAPVVSAGGALAAGNGYSLHDIRAKKARNAAKKSAVSNHAKITEPKAGKTIQLQDTNDKISVVSDAGDVLAELQDDSYTMKIPQLLDETVIEKVETPASKAVNEGVTVNGVAVVGSASEAAKIEITSSEDSGENDNGTDEADDNGENDTEATEDDVKDGNADASNPVIDIKPDTEVEEGAEDLSDRVIAECDGYVRVRATPDEEGEIVGKLYNHSAGTWLGKEGDWYKIESGNVVGYVKGEYVKTGHAAVQLAAEVGQRMAKVTTTTLKIRSVLLSTIVPFFLTSDNAVPIPSGLPVASTTTS